MVAIDCISHSDFGSPNTVKLSPTAMWICIAAFVQSDENSSRSVHRRQYFRGSGYKSDFSMRREKGSSKKTINIPPCVNSIFECWCNEPKALLKYLNIYIKPFFNLSLFYRSCYIKIQFSETNYFFQSLTLRIFRAWNIAHNIEY